MRSPLISSVLSAVLALQLFGCGSNTDPLEVNQRSAVEQVVYGQFAAYQNGDMKAAFSTLRKDCQRSLGLSLYSAMVRSEVALVEEMTGEQMAELELRDVKVESNGAFVTFTSRVYLSDGTPATAASGTYEVMVFEDGRWRFRDCPNPRV